MSTVLAVVGLGSNVGDRLAHLRAALDRLAAAPGCRLVRVSRVWETEYVGPGAQEPFLNACVALHTGLTPARLLTLCQQLERAAGRAPQTHMLPRPLDLDLLLHGAFCGTQGGVQVPHPTPHQRNYLCP